MTASNPIEAPLSIANVNVEKLFGKYNYSLPGSSLSSASYSSLLILYGDNGCGKTTVLKLLFHILSPALNRGHRSFIARVPFKKFSIELADGTNIDLNREDDDLIGSYTFSILKGGKVIAETNYEYNIDKKNVTGEDEDVLRYLDDLQLVIFFLGDDRVLDSDVFEDEERSTRRSYVEYMENIILEDISQAIKVGKERNINIDFALKKSIQRTRDWVRQQALRGSNLGAANVHSIYEDIVERIVNSGGGEKESTSTSPDSSVEELINELKTQGERSQAFSRFGLISPLEIEKLVNLLEAVDESDNKSVVIQNVLNPYLDSIAARLNALQETQDVLTVFVNTINEFLRDKKIELNVRDGLSILIDKKRNLPPEKLSSGEKQLLLLLCNTLTAREKATIFIIDEPEISLNVKWQRNLIKALLDCTKGSQVQFLFATHSIELLSQYRRNVVKLENRAYGE